MSKTRESQLTSVDISGFVIGITGSKPFAEESVASLIRKLEGIIDNDAMQGPKPKYIVVGRENYDKNYLQQAIEDKAGVIFLTQETFIGYILFGTDIDDLYEKEEIDSHPGLSCINDLGGFPPKKVLSFGVDQDATSHWKQKSFLRGKYGYHTGMLWSERKNCLIKAVREEGLYAVANHISWLVRLNMGNRNIKDAVNIWIKDLDWLKYTYHGRAGNDFIWPY